MKRYLIGFLCLIALYTSCIRKTTVAERPKLVVGLVIDQMRWDYLYRYAARYGNDGFKRLMREGYNCEQTNNDYLPTFTGPGHSCIYTGSVPSINGIAGNNWVDNSTGKVWYCVDDDKVHMVGGNIKESSYSPRNLLTTTVTDELKLATNFRSKVYGIAIKDRGAILPAGHAANAAYWYNDKTGEFVTSSYYDTLYQNPQWLRSFNSRREADSLSKKDWSLLYDMATYTQSTPDSTTYEDAYKGEANPVFPHKFNMLSTVDRFSALKSSPAGNTLTLDMARACIEGAKMGESSETDFLCVSLSSPDYTGHQFAPNSVEQEDMYLRLDKEIADFLKYLDQKVGKGNYLIFLTADHGGAHNPQFLSDNKIPAGVAMNFTADLNRFLSDTYKNSSNKKDSNRNDMRFIDTILNYQVYLNETLLEGDKTLNRDDIRNATRKWILNEVPRRYNYPVSYVIDMEDIDKTPLPEPIRQMAINGYNRRRSGCLQIILNPGWLESDRYTGSTHGSWNPYDTHIPLLWYGWHVPAGATYEAVNMTDIAPTLAALLHIQVPNGCIGKPIKDMIGKQIHAYN